MTAQHAARTVVGDTGVRTLQVVLDADVAQHVVGQRAQQPHRVDDVGQLAAERLQAPGRFRHEREIVVLAVVAAATRADVDAGAVAVVGGGGFVQGVAPGGDARRVDRAARRVESEHVGAPDEFEDLAITEQLSQARDYGSRRRWFAAQPAVSHSVIGPIALRPDCSAFQISAGLRPAAQIAPLPVMTMRWASAITRSPLACETPGSCSSRRSRANSTWRCARAARAGVRARCRDARTLDRVRAGSR